MNYFYLVLFLLIYSYFHIQVNASTKCVSATGIVRCSKNPEKHANVKVYLMDRDGIGPILQWIDPDDYMKYKFVYFLSFVLF
jgi:hypothetical protein